MAGERIHSIIIALLLALKFSNQVLGYPTKKSPSLLGVNDLQLKEYTVYRNTSITIVVERISPDFKQVLKKDGKRIMGLDSQKNKTTYTHYSDAEIKLNRAQYSMKTINENQIAVMIHGWTPSVAGNYTVYHYYTGANPPKAPHPTKFRIKFAASTTITTAPTTSAFSRTTQKKTIHPMDAKSDDGPDVITIAKIATPCALGVVIFIACIALYFCLRRRGRCGMNNVDSSTKKHSWEMLNNA